MLQRYMMVPPSKYTEERLAVGKNVLEEIASCSKINNTMQYGIITGSVAYGGCLDISDIDLMAIFGGSRKRYANRISEVGRIVSRYKDKRGYGVHLAVFPENDFRRTWNGCIRSVATGQFFNNPLQVIGGINTKTKPCNFISAILSAEPVIGRDNHTILLQDLESRLESDSMLRKSIGLIMDEYLDMLKMRANKIGAQVKPYKIA